MGSKSIINRRTVWILLVLLAFNAVLIAGAIIINQRTQDSTSSEPERTVAMAPSFSLRDAYGRAQQQALTWQQDIYLVSVTTSWRLDQQDDLSLYQSTWTFSFYSPSAGQAQTIVVNQQSAQPGRTRSLPAPPHRVEADWSINSDDLLVTFLGYGGDEFVGNHSHVNIHIQLKGDDTGRSIWYVSALDPVARQSVIVGIDAQSREVVLNRIEQ